MQNKLNGEFFSQSLHLIFSNFLKLFSQIAVLIIYSRMLSVADYGKYQSGWLYIAVISSVSLFGLPSLILSSGISGITAFLSINKKRSATVISLFTILPLLYLFFFGKNFNNEEAFSLCILIISQNISIVCEAVAVKNGNTKKVLNANILINILFLSAHILILLPGYSFTYLMWSLNVVFILKSFLLNINSANAGRNIPAKTVGRQWTLLGFIDVINIVFRWADKWLILLFLSITEFAVYFNGAYEIPVFLLLTGAVGNIMIVRLINFPQSGRELLHSSVEMLAPFVFVSFSFLLFNYSDFFLLLFSDKYAASVPIFFIAIFVLPVRITNYTSILQSLQRSDIILKGTLLELIIVIVLLVILYPLFKMEGIIASFVAATWFQAFYYLRNTSVLLNTSIKNIFPWKWLFTTLVICILVFATIYFSAKAIIPAFKMYAGITTAVILMIYFYGRKFISSL